MVALAKPEVPGQRFGLLTITGEVPTRGRGRLVSCICECGRSVVTLRHAVVGGRKRSCGCLQGRHPATEPGPNEAPPVIECECGNTKDASAEACERCTWFDGGGPEQALVNALRVLGECATLEALALEMECTTRTVHRGLAKLRATGRVVSMSLDHGDSFERHDFAYVPSVRDEKDGPMKNHSVRSGYYVHIPRKRKELGGAGGVAFHILKNTRRG